MSAMSPICRSITLRLLSIVLITGLVVLPATALGKAPVSQFHVHFTNTFSTDVCGIAVNIDSVVTISNFVYADGSTEQISTLRATVTNPANGKSVIVSAAGPATSEVVGVDEEAGTITTLVSFKGLPQKVQTANGPVLLRDAGFFAFATTFDLVTGETISSEIIVNNGPHPDGESDNTLFCEVITAALT